MQMMSYECQNLCECAHVCDILLRKYNHDTIVDYDNDALEKEIDKCQSEG